MARHNQPNETPDRLRGQRQPWSRFRVGVVAIVLIVIASYFGFAKHIPFTHAYRVHAVFESSNNLRPGSPVRIAGVNVGKVTSVDRYRGTNMTDVTMQIQDEGLPIHRDATLKIRPRIFLEGNFFVDLKPGTPSSPEVPENGTIGPTQTSTPVQLDELFTALQADTRADLQHVLEEYGASLNSKPTAAEDATQVPEVQGLTGAQALNKSYDNAGKALKGATLVNSALLGTHPHDLSNLIAATAKLSTRLRPHEAQLQQLLESFNTTASSFAAQSSSLQAAVGLLGPTVTNADAAFKSLDASLPATRAFARAFTPAVLETPATVAAALPWIAQTRALLRPSELQGLLAQLQPATQSLAKLTDENLTFLPALDTANRCFAQTVIPAGNIPVDDGKLSARRPNGSIVENFKEFWYGMVGLAGEGSGADGNGSYIRTGLGGGQYTTSAGVSERTGGTFVGNATFPPRGTSPLVKTNYPSVNGNFPSPPVKTNVPCYRSKLPDVNGPQAGPGKAPPTVVSPTPPPYNPTAGTTASASAAPESGR
ncbi:MAG TPA: MlaD family protein [Conexibacter sp.]|nr:MlaD family protein [Conexibacter sp.]